MLALLGLIKSLILLCVHFMAPIFHGLMASVCLTPHKHYVIINIAFEEIDVNGLSSWLESFPLVHIILISCLMLSSECIVFVVMGPAPFWHDNWKNILYLFKYLFTPPPSTSTEIEKITTYFNCKIHYLHLTSDEIILLAKSLTTYLTEICKDIFIILDKYTFCSFG